MTAAALRPGRSPVVVAAAAAFGVAMIGGAMVQIGPWYEALEKSPLNPPNWAFAPAWTAIYALVVLAAVKGWRAADTSRRRALLLSLFFVNAVLNIAWTAIFFTFERPDIALAEAATLWASVLALIVFLSRFSLGAAALLAPYLVWVSYALHLNYAVVRLNGPFG